MIKTMTVTTMMAAAMTKMTAAAMIRVTTTLRIETRPHDRSRHDDLGTP